ncbi:MAG: creatininase family protein [Candidatus Bathyarchaeota archaeon]|nr:creatininase family protein [Candidatus Bathyarchaeota archaeon]
MCFHLEEKSWKTVEDELKTSDTVIVPLGALEAHGPHNPVGCCYLLAESASRDVGGRTGISVTPTIPFGVSEGYKNFPGTVTVSSESLYRYVDDVCRSLIRSGFRKIIFFSAHGGNNLPVLRELSGRLREAHRVLCAVLHLWGLVQRLAPSDMAEPGLRLGHGGDPTTSVMLHLHPELVDMGEAEWKPLRQPMEGFETRSYGVHAFKGVPLNIPLFAEEVASSGVMGDPTRASREKGKRLYERLVEYLAEFVEAFSRLEPNLSRAP